MAGSGPHRRDKPALRGYNLTLAARDILERAKAPVYSGTSGATGMHLYIPPGAKYRVDQSTQFARSSGARSKPGSLPRGSR